MPTSEELLQSLGEEVKGLGESAERKLREVESRMLLLEQKADARHFSGGIDGGDLDIGRKVIESDGFKALQSGSTKSTGRINIGNIKTALVNATGASQPLVAADRVGIVPPITRRLTIRDVMPSSATNSNSIEFPKEASFTNNAAPQYSAGLYENVTKAESALTFNLTAVPVTTLAHWIPVSRQLLDDAPAIQGYVNGRLLYGLKLKEEAQLLTGSGVQGNLSGLVTNATTYDTTNYSTPASDTYLDIARKAALQLQVADLNPNVLVMNPADWDVLLSTKESGSGISSGQYIFADPRFGGTREVWGMQVVVTNSMTSGQFLVMDATAAGMIFDRQTATVEISLDHSDYRTRNMALILVEERLALCVFNTSAILYGGWPFGS
jgi:HK97 family phage major capsid protein